MQQERQTREIRGLQPCVQFPSPRAARNLGPNREAPQSPPSCSRRRFEEARHYGAMAPVTNKVSRP